MSLRDELATALHGVPTGRGGLEVVCDLYHEIPEPVDTAERVQYECIRVDESVTIFGRLGYPCYDMWTPDLLRCRDCERESLSMPTDGFEEALVTLDLHWTGDQHILDTRDLTLLDHSPVDDGQDPPDVPLSVLETVVETRDPGYLRRSRVDRAIDYFRENDNDDLADLLEPQLHT